MLPRAPITRRTFLSATAAAAVSAKLSPRTALSDSRILGANDRLRLGVIGLGGRGRYLMELLQGPDVEIVALCDVYQGALDAARARVTGPAPRTTGKYRELLDAPDVDAVVVATPDHWHAPITVEACDAGKDVYLEKPLAHTAEDGRAIVHAAQESGRIVQVGLQQRSGAHYREAKARYFDSGRIGRLGHVRTWWHGQNPRELDPSLNRRPDGLDWERFVGPAPARPFDPRQFHHWRNYADFGSGQVGDLFTHWVDVVQWYTGDTLPQAASTIGGILHFPDGRDWPDTVSLLVEYPGVWTCSFEASLAHGARGYGVEFLGTGGRLSIDRNRYTFTPVDGEPERGGLDHDITRDHTAEFVECLRGHTAPNASVLTSHRSTVISHLANQAYLRRERVTIDEVGQGG